MSSHSFPTRRSSDLKGAHVPVFSLNDLEPYYIDYTKNLSAVQLDLGRWLPSLSWQIRRLVPGELVAIVADTGVGKTGILQNIALACKPLATLFFELELPQEIMFERFVSIHANLRAIDVESAYASGDYAGSKALERINWLYICTEPKMTANRLEELIDKSELRIGERPRVVIIDYVQLMASASAKSRYEKISDVAESLKIVAKATRTIIIFASQISRKGDEVEIFLHDAKDSGSIENSSGLVLGAWRDKEDSSRMWIKVLKNTKGKAGAKIPCRIDGERMRITEEKA